MVNGKTSIDYITDLNTVTKQTCDFFYNRGIFHSEDRGFPSYNKVMGINFIDVPDGFPISNKVWPVDNERTRDISDAIDGCEKLGRTLLVRDKSQELSVLSRNFMIYGGTLPIRVAYKIGAPKQKGKFGDGNFDMESLYVKQMNLNRLFLGALYHLAMGRDYCMAFSESSIVEIETKGPTILEAYQKQHTILNDPNIKRELIKLGVIAYFLSLYDMDNGANIILDPLQRFDVIDFDKGFFGAIPDPRESIVNPFAYEWGFGEGGQLVNLPDDKLMRHFGSEEINLWVREEMDRVYRNLKRKYDVFMGIVELMGSIEYYNLAAQELYNEKDVVAYFLKRYQEFKPKGG
jgi:hypothetical protein